MNEVKPLSFEELRRMNYNFELEHHFTEFEVNLLNDIRMSFPKRNGTDKVPKILDVIEFVDEYGEYHPKALVVSDMKNGNVMICQTPHIPFISLSELKKENEISSFFGRMGGSMFEERPISNLVCVGTREIEVQCFSERCFNVAHSSVVVPVMVNAWQLKWPVNPFGEYSTKDYCKYHVYFHNQRKHPKDNDGYASDFLTGLYFKNQHQYESWLKSSCGTEFRNDDDDFATVFTYHVNERYYNYVDFKTLGDDEHSSLLRELPNQNDFNEITKENIDDDCEYQNHTLAGSEYLIKKIIDNKNHIITIHKMKRHGIK